MVSKNRENMPVIELFGTFTHGAKQWVNVDPEVEDILNKTLGFKTRGGVDNSKLFTGGYAKGIVQMGDGSLALIDRATREGAYTTYHLENGAVIKTRHICWDDAVDFTLHLYLPGEKAPACWWEIAEDGCTPVRGHVVFQKKFEGSNADYFPR
jgi:hypothetical protein